MITGLTGYYGLLDLGFRSGITQYMTRHLATRNFLEMNRTASTAFMILAIVGVAILLASVLVCLLAPMVFRIPSEVVGDTRLAILVIGASTAIQFPCFPFSAVFTATQRYDLANAVGISTRLLVAAAVFCSLKMGYGLVGLSIVTAAGDLLGYGVRWRLAYRILPELVVSPRLAAWRAIWPLASFGVWAVLLNGAQQLKGQAGTFLIGITMPIAAVAPFALASGLLVYVAGVFTPIGIVFYPAMAHLDASNQSEDLRRLYLKGSRILLIIGVVAALISGFWAGDFFHLWIGNRLVGSGGASSVANIFRILIAGFVCMAGQRVGEQAFFATGRLRLLAILFAIEAVANLSLCLCLVRPFGLGGVAVGVAIPALIFQGIVQPIAICRILGIRFSRYCRETLMRPLLVGIILAAVFGTARLEITPANNWGILVVHGLLAGSIALLVIAGVGIEKGERKRLIYGAAKQLLPYLRLSPMGRFFFPAPPAEE